MDVRRKLLDYGYEDIIYFTDYDYASALIGVTYDNGVYRAIYDYDKMLDYLIATGDFDYEQASDWVSYNTMRALPYMGNGAPIIMNTID